MKMVFVVYGTTEVIQLVVEFLKKEADFTYRIENDSPDAGDLEVTFDNSNQREYVPYFMKWLHFESSALSEKIRFAVAARFQSIPTLV